MVTMIYANLKEECSLEGGLTKWKTIIVHWPKMKYFASVKQSILISPRKQIFHFQLFHPFLTSHFFHLIWSYLPSLTLIKGVSVLLNYYYFFFFCEFMVCQKYSQPALSIVTTKASFRFRFWVEPENRQARKWKIGGKNHTNIKNVWLAFCSKFSSCFSKPGNLFLI